MVAATEPSVLLPTLRQDLKLLKGSPDEDGAPRWLLFDAMRNQYFAISRDAFDLVRHWQPEQEIGAFVKGLSEQGYPYSEEEVSAFTEFLIHNNLVMARSSELSARVSQQQQAKKTGFWRWLIHNYLFIRIPLLRPDAWLDRWAPKLQWLGSSVLQSLILLLGIIGGVMVLRQWDSFLATFMHFFSLEGVLFYSITLALVKSAHEMGHALTAKWQGCRVASMGVAFLVLFPVLYTDTTDAWRLQSRKRRLRIVTAGVRVEICLALLATFLWNFLPDGPLRSAAFFVATTSWVTSLLVNISPFLRFDGYYAFSDWLGIENLQSRAFEMGRWSLRRILFGIDDPLPEPMPRQRCRIMIIYAWCTWLYRFFLFLGIALLVYELFFKLLGILLFVVEILWFIAFPMIKELKVWWHRRADFRPSWGRLTALGLVTGLIVLMLIPLPARIQLPAVLKAAQHSEHFAPIPARLVEWKVQPGESVTAGQSLVLLASDELDYRQNRLEEELKLLQLRMQRQASSVLDKASTAVLAQQLEQLSKQLAGVKARKAQLVIRATHAGVVSSKARIAPGSWVDTQQALLAVTDSSQVEWVAYIPESAVELVEPGQQGIYISDRGEREAIEVVLSRIDVVAAGLISHPELTSLHGGEIAVRKSASDKLIPEQSYYQARMTAAQPLPNVGQQRQPGTVILTGHPRSLIGFNLQRLLAIGIRESGF